MRVKGIGQAWLTAAAVLAATSVSGQEANLFDCSRLQPIVVEHGRVPV